MRVISAGVVFFFYFLCICVAEAQHVSVPRFDCEMLIVPASVNGIERCAIIDTGASAIMMDERLAVNSLRVAHSREIVTRTISGVQRIRLYDNMKYRVPGLPEQTGSVSTFDLEECRTITGQDIQLLIGMSAMKRYVLSLSPTCGELSSGVSDSVDIGKEFAITWNHAGIPQCNTQFGDGSLLLTSMDTGLNVELALEKAELTSLLRRGEARRVGGFKTGQQRAPEHFVVREFEVFGVLFRNVFAVEAKMNAIGLPILCQLKLTLDFPNSRVFRGASDESGLDSFPPNASGIYVNRTVDRTTQVLSVFPDSPAGSVGVQNGDMLLAIDGITAEQLSIIELRERLRKAGTTVRLAIERNGESLQIDVPLEHPFEYPPKWPPRPEPSKDQLDFEKFLKGQESGNPDSEPRPECATF